MRVLWDESGCFNKYFVLKVDEIFVEVYKVLVFWCENLFINVVCNKWCLKFVKESDGRIFREVCWVDVKNVYFRKSLKIVGERVFEEGKVVNFSR